MMNEQKIIDSIFEESLRMARHPIDGSLLSQELVLAAMKDAIKKALDFGYDRGRNDQRCLDDFNKTDF